MSLDDIRLPPHSLEAEQSVLGGLLIDAGAYDRIAGAVAEQDFYQADHRLIWRAIARLADAGEAVDVLTVADAMDGEALECAGGLAYLGTLANNTPGAANIRRYAEIVREHALRRELQRVAAEIAERAGRRGDFASSVEFAQASIMAITESRNAGGPRRAAECVPQIAAAIEERAAHPEKLSGIATGLSILDEILDGLRPGDLIVIAGRPGMGKTVLALNIGECAAVRYGRTVLLFSLEMSAQSLARRLVASVGRLSQKRMRDGKLTSEDWIEFAEDCEDAWSRCGDGSADPCASGPLCMFRRKMTTDSDRT
jgi:replicative DNA helicase